MGHHGSVSLNVNLVWGVKANFYILDTINIIYGTTWCTCMYWQTHQCVSVINAWMSYIIMLLTELIQWTVSDRERNYRSWWVATISWMPKPSECDKVLIQDWLQLVNPDGRYLWFRASPKGIDQFFKQGRWSGKVFFSRAHLKQCLPNCALRIKKESKIY